MNEQLHVLLLTQQRLPESLLDRVRVVSPRLRVDHRTAHTLDELGDVWSGVEVLYTTGLMPSPNAAPDLHWVQGHFAGVEHFLTHPLLKQITLTTASGLHASNMAEYIVMMMLAFGHRLRRMIEYQQRAEWPRDRWPLFVPLELRGATLGIVGYGSIGRETARLAKAFGLRVIATKRDPQSMADDGWRLPEMGDEAVQHVDRLYAAHELRAMLSECDFVAITVPLTPETHHLISAAELQAMKRDAVLINVARGGVIDEVALIEALHSGTIGGAGLDVFEHEPLATDSPLWSLPNVILSPHVSGFTPHYDERAMTLFADNLHRYLNGEPLLNVVDVKRGY